MDWHSDWIRANLRWVHTGRLTHHRWWDGLHIQKNSRERQGQPDHRATIRNVSDKAQIGNSLFDKEGSEKVASLIEKAKSRHIKVVLPVDYVTGDKFDKNAEVL